MKAMLATLALSSLGFLGCDNGAISRGQNDASGSGVDFSIADDASPRIGSDGGVQPPTDACSAAAQLIYVIDQDGTLSSFSPNQKDFSKSTFKDLGSLNCKAKATQSPFSMAVDRNATAWVHYVDSAATGASSDALFKVDTTSLACAATSYVGGQQGLEQFGMGFVSSPKDPTIENLFIAGGLNAGTGTTSSLGTIDLQSFKVNKLNANLNGQPELSGTGDARLFGFFPEAAKPRVSQLDQTTGAEGMSFPLAKLAGTPSAWAFAFWGGDFWIFLQRTSDPATIVWHLKTADGSVEQLPTGNRTIVGAGVSTCAPTKPIQ